MKRCLAALLAAIVVSEPAPCGAIPATTDSARTAPRLAQAAVLDSVAVVRDSVAVAAPSAPPFEVVPLPTPAVRPHRAAYACLVVGAGLIGGSFALAHRADRAYDRYLVAQVPGDIERWYDETTRYDRWSSGALLGGEALVAMGLYLRFLRRPPPPTAFLIGPGACAVTYRF